jgi:hypothetical protein
MEQTEAAACDMCVGFCVGNGMAVLILMRKVFGIILRKLLRLGVRNT